MFRNKFSSLRTWHRTLYSEHSSILATHLFTELWHLCLSSLRVSWRRDHANRKGVITKPSQEFQRHKRYPTAHCHLSEFSHPTCSKIQLLFCYCIKLFLPTIPLISDPTSLGDAVDTEEFLSLFSYQGEEKPTQLFGSKHRH